MNISRLSPQAFITGALAASALWFPTLSSGNNIGAGDIADLPLFASFSVESNVFFMLDDSGSMHWELMVSPNNANATGDGLFSVESNQTVLAAPFVPTISRTYIYVNANNPENGTSSVPPITAIELMPDSPLNDKLETTHEGNWRARNPQYNRTYYDPARIYKPWAGVNVNGNAFGQADPTAVYRDPFNPPPANQRIDLTTTSTQTFLIPLEDEHAPSFTGCFALGIGGGQQSAACSIDLNFYPAIYHNWADDGDGVIEINERSDTVQIINTRSSYPKFPNREDCNATECTYAQEINNFANWWQYHARREFAMKFGIGEVISDATGVRMGLATINRNPADEPIGDILTSRIVEKEIASMNDDPTSGAKRSLLNGLYSIRSAGGTPLRDALRDVGDYYSCGPDGTGSPGTNIFPAGTVDNPTPCPIERGEPEDPLGNSPGECQQNFAILFSDGFRNRPLNGFNANSDGDDSTFVSGGITYSFDGSPFSDTESNTLADVAMHFYERDLATGINNSVPIRCGLDENPAQHMVTYTVGFGVSGTIDGSTANPLPPTYPQYGYDNQCTAQPTTTFPWPSTAGNPGKIDDMLHAAYNGRGEFFSAQSSEQLAEDLQAAIQSISDRAGSGTSVSFNASVINTDTAVYLAEFNTTRWSGNLSAFSVNSDGNINPNSTWNAAEELENIPWQNRNIWTHTGTAAGDIARAPFEWNSLSTEQQDDLRTNPSGVLDDSATGQTRLNYIHGDRSNENSNPGGTLREREEDNILGDIIQSGPVFVGVPSLPWTDAAPFPDQPGQLYSEFRENLSDVVRDPITNQVIDVVSTRLHPEVVYVGANDGMLHGFDANDGRELFAYIPSYLFSNPQSDGTHPANTGLHYLSDPSYNHRYFHDMTPTISDAYINGEWRTILIGGHRAGAEGLFALDITSDPDKDLPFSSHNPVLWEFRGEEGSIADHKLGDNDLGLSFSQPQIAMTNATDASGNNRWAAIFGNGYNQSGSDEAQLFVLFLDANTTDGWDEGTDYIKITTGENGGTDFNNGLSSPSSIDLDGNGTVDRVYAGDLAGNVWSFDLCAINNNGDCATTTNGDNSVWRIAHGTTISPEPLYRGVSTNSVTTQHITTQPQVIRNPATQNIAENAPNLLVLFGTGRFIADGDGSITTQQSFYGVWDAGIGEITTGQLLQQTLTDGILNNLEIRTSSDNPIQYSQPGDNLPGDDLGWRVDLPATGERNISNAIVRDDIVFFSTSIPSDRACDAGGSGFIMFLDVVNGGQPDTIIFDTNNDGEFDSDDLLGTKPATGAKFDGGLPSSPAFLGDNLYTTGTNTTTASSNNVSTPISTIGRVSWEELVIPLGNPVTTTPSP